MNSTAHNQSGFTLIELLISLTLMGMIMVLLTSGLRLISSSWDRNTVRMAKLEGFNRLGNIFRRDVEGVRRIVQKVDGRNKFVFSGTSRRLAFVVLEPPFPTLPGLYLIEYNYLNDQLKRSRKKFNKITGSISSEDLSSNVTLLDNNFTYSFEYGFTRNNKIRWVKQWGDEIRLPDMIKLIVRDQNKKDPLKTIPIIAKLKIDGEQECIAGSIIPCTVRTGGLLQNLKKLSLDKKR